MSLARPGPPRRPRQPRVVRGLLHPGFGPILAVTLRGQNGVSHAGAAVLDTGASMSAIDRALARAMELPSPGAATWSAITASDGVPAMSPLRRCTVGLDADQLRWELDLIEVPSLSHAVVGYHVVVLLGWDFLVHCRLDLDGPNGMYTLELPRARRGH